ncbi:unnamed protein product [Allacma fusca]|uniref:Uncharacterized protein n=1 Tax=Allacma fusca TaxID=39272 RepID=A0A8J2P865_9HEXA|nr:unnamed protein product [Allacma fusca]
MFEHDCHRRADRSNNVAYGGEGSEKEDVAPAEPWVSTKERSLMDGRLRQARCVDQGVYSGYISEEPTAFCGNSLSVVNLEESL